MPLLTPRPRRARLLPFLALVLAVTVLVAAAQPAFGSVPNDPQFPRQWALHNTGQVIGGVAGLADADIDAPEAWDLTTGGAGVTVAVVEGVGVDPLQEDLAPNLDMASGYDFGMNDPDATEEYGSIHGTQVTTVIAAAGNNGLGMAGVAWRARIMPLKIGYAPNGSSSASSEAAAYRYAGSHGARVANASFNLDPTRNRQEVIDAINASPNTLFVSPAGSRTNGVVSDNDTNPRYPCNYDLPNHICVGGSDERDRLWSNYGAKSVDLVAPARQIEVAQGRTTYGPRDGTSFATAMVSGVAALYFARYPSATVADVRRAIVQGVDVIPSMIGKTVTGGRLNAAHTLSIPPDGTSPPSPPGATGTSPGPVPGADTTTQPKSPRLDRKLVLRLRRTQRLSDVLRKGIRVSVEVPAQVKLDISLRLSSAMAKRLRLPTIVGRTVQKRASGALVKRVKLRKLAIKRLRHQRRVVLKVRLRATPPEGMSQTVVRNVTLVRTLSKKRR